MEDREIRSVRHAREDEDTFLDWDGKATLFDEVEEEEEGPVDEDGEAEEELDF